jgi:hypothetical protein
MSRRFRSSRKAALAVLNSDIWLSGRAYSFLGQLIADDPDELSPRQEAWLTDLLAEAGQPPLRLRGSR